MHNMSRPRRTELTRSSRRIVLCEKNSQNKSTQRFSRGCRGPAMHVIQRKRFVFTSAGFIQEYQRQVVINAKRLRPDSLNTATASFPAAPIITYACRSSPEGN
jgi:glycine/serine hydroxymethyltransferase